MSREIFTHCRYCASLCGLAVTVGDDGQVLQIDPDRTNPYTWHDFCKKGKTAHERVAHPQRITMPLRRVGERWEPATYEEALTDIAERFNGIIRDHGSDAVGGCIGNPLGLNFGGMTFLAGLLDAIGTGNRYFVSSVDTNAWHVVSGAMFGAEVFPLTCDIDECHCFLLVGMDPAVSKWGWVDNAPAGWSRVTGRLADGDVDVIVVDPRRSATARKATTHVAIRPGGDWAFLLGLVKVIFEAGLDRPATAVPVAGVDIVRALAGAARLDDLASRSGVSVENITDVAHRFARASTAMCVTHTGASHVGDARGTVAEWLGWVLNAVTNRLDTRGGRRFERGYLDVVRMWELMAPKSKHRTRLRDLPTIAGFHSLAELAGEISTPGAGQIRGLILAAGNPVISGPQGDALDKAFAGLECLVAVDLVQRESHRHAHWLIPAEHWLERDELTLVFGSLQEYPYVQYGRSAVQRPATAMPEWQFYVDLALAMGRPLFGKKGVNSLVRTSRWLSGVFGRPGLEITPHTVERLLVASGRRLTMRDIKAHEHGWVYGEKRYGDMAKTLRTSDKAVHCAPPRFVRACQDLLTSASSRPHKEYPFILVNRRHRESMNSWLNESPSLFVRSRTNTLEMHPDDAAAIGVADGEAVTVRSDTGSFTLPVSIDDGIRPGVVATGHGWGSRIFDPVHGTKPRAYGANRNSVVSNEVYDPLSQLPALSSTAVAVEPADVSRRGRPRTG